MSMKAPPAGELDTLIGIYRKSNTPTGDTDLDTDLDLLIQRWAKIEPVGTAVYVGSFQTDTGITHRIYIDFTEGIKAEDVIRTSDGRQFRVQRSTNLNGRRVCTVLEVEELGDEETV